MLKEDENISAQKTSSINPKSEYRNSKQTESQMNPNAEKIQNTNPKHLVWNFLIFEHLDLFRISDFVLRIFCSWRLCIPSALLRACFAQVTLFTILVPIIGNPKSKIQNGNGR
jgi:hypothetical protein